VESFKNLFFVGDGGPQKVQEDTIKAMRAVINRNSSYTEFISLMLQGVDYLRPRTTSVQVARPLRYIRQELPPDVGFVYMIVSKNQPSLGYVGETISFKKRLAQHNSLHGGSTQTEAGRPWLPVVILTGFGDRSVNGETWEEVNRRNRKAFEKRWRKHNSTPGTQARNSVQMLRNGRKTLHEFESSLPDLVWLPLLELTEKGLFPLI
jgi:predicted GIY-YIG superfamily endonuclease